LIFVHSGGSRIADLMLGWRNFEIISRISMEPNVIEFALSGTVDLRSREALRIVRSP